MKTDELTPIFYANDDGRGKYIGLRPVTRDEVENTLKLQASISEDSTDFLSRLYWLWDNPATTITEPPRVA